MWSHWSGVSPIPMTAVLVRRGDLGTDITRREARTNTKVDTVVGDEPTSQRPSKIASEPPETEGEAGTESRSSLQKETTLQTP